MSFISRIKKWFKFSSELPHLDEDVYIQVLIDAKEELDSLHTCDHYVALEDRFADFLALSHYRIIEKRKELYGELI